MQNPCDIISEFGSQVNESFDLFEKTRRETGFTICKVLDDSKLSTTSTCVGEKCFLTEKPCYDHKEVFGTFHTHPYGIFRPSPIDIKTALTFRMPFFCIGTERNSKRNVKCFSINTEHPNFEITRHKILTAEGEELERLSEIAKKNFIKEFECKLETT